MSETPIQPDQFKPETATPETPDVPQPVEAAIPPLPETPEPGFAATMPAAESAVPVAAAVGTHRGTGRRKSSVARVRLMAGAGKIMINGRELEKFFTEPQDRVAVTAPLQASGKLGLWDVLVNVQGGGHTGQAGAIKLGVARALVAADASVEPTLRDGNYLTRDARRVERKKYGRRKARRRFQFSKR